MRKINLAWMNGTPREREKRSKNAIVSKRFGILFGFFASKCMPNAPNDYHLGVNKVKIIIFKTSHFCVCVIFHMNKTPTRTRE